MIRRGQLEPHRVVFWSLMIIGLVITWRLLPTTFSQLMYLVLFFVSVIAVRINQIQFAGLSAVFFAVVSINYWQLTTAISPLLTGLLIVLVCTVIGKLIEASTDSKGSHLIYWLILGFAVAQTNAIFIQWPISFFSRSLLTGLSFYLFWQLLEMREGALTKQLAGHFLFVMIAVIVVISTIIWTNFPHLAPF